MLVEDVKVRKENDAPPLLYSVFARLVLELEDVEGARGETLAKTTKTTNRAGRGLKRFSRMSSTRLIPPTHLTSEATVTLWLLM